MALLGAALDATQIVLIVLIGLLVIAYPLLMLRRNKKENQRMTEQTNSLKRGDKVLTSSGVYGTIVDLKLEGNAKQVTIETGTDKFKSYMTVDAYAIYQVIKDEPKQAVETAPEAKPVEKVAKKGKKSEENVAEQAQAPEEKQEEPKQEQAPAKVETKQPAQTKKVRAKTNAKKEAK